MAIKDNQIAFERLLSGFKEELKLQGNTLSVLFDSALFSFERKVKATVRANPIEDPKSLAYGIDHIEQRYGFNILESLKQARIAEHAQNIYAGSLFLVLSGWIKTLQDKLNVSSPYEAGEAVNETKLAKLIWATANNFRHYEEWKRPNSQAKENIAILNAAGIYGKNLDFICASQVLQIIGAKTYEQLERKVLAIGDDLMELALASNTSPKI